MKIFVATLGSEIDFFSPIPTSLATFEVSCLKRPPLDDDNRNRTAAPQIGWKRRARGHRLLLADLERVALEQHCHPVRERAHHREVVGNEQHRHMGAALQLTIEEENGEGARSRPALRYPLPQVPPIAGVMNGAYGSGKAFRVPQSNPAGKKRPCAFAAG